MDEARFRHRGTIGWLVGDGEKAQVFLPRKMSPIGPLRHFAAARHFGRYRDWSGHWTGLMSTQPSRRTEPPSS